MDRLTKAVILVTICLIDEADTTIQRTTVNNVAFFARSLVGDKQPTWLI